MEGGSPALIRQRWNLPLYYEQLRYWGDHPRVDQMVAWYLKIPHKKTPPSRKDGKPSRPIDWAALDAPLTDAERGRPGGTMIPLK